MLLAGGVLEVQNINDMQPVQLFKDVDNSSTRIERLTQRQRSACDSLY